jgi:hypothetical protein
MDKGWIKSWRKLIESAIFNNEDAEYLKLWVYLLHRASHEERETIIGGEKVRLRTGSLITSRGKISEDCKIEQSKVERILDYLKREQQIEQQNLHKCRLLSITNWKEYQNNEQQNEQQVNTNKNNSISTKEILNTKTSSSLILSSSSKGNGKDRFDELWEIYPWKDGKGRARKAFHKLKPDEELFKKILGAVEEQKTSDKWTKDNGQYIPLLSSWLNDEGWLSEPKRVKLNLVGIEEGFKQVKNYER